MKIANVDGSQALDATKGRRSTKNAGSRGITFRDAATEAHPVRDLTVIGGTITDNDDGTAVLTIGGSGSGGSPAGDLVTYTPTLTAATTNPTLGNGTLVGKYAYITAKLVWIRIYFQYGSTSAAGSGEWRFALPFTAHATGKQVIGFIIHDVGTSYYIGQGLIDAGGTFVGPMLHAQAPNLGSSNAALQVTHNSPFTRAATDEFILSGVYETA